MAFFGLKVMPDMKLRTIDESGVSARLAVDECAARGVFVNHLRRHGWIERAARDDQRTNGSERGVVSHCRV